MVGEFKDDELQEHGHRAVLSMYKLGGGSYNGVALVNYQDNIVTSVVNARVGDVTRGKRKAVRFIIKVL